MPGANNILDFKSLSSQFLTTRKISIQIAEPLSEQDMQIQSMPEASPTKWHLAHTSWAFETFILKNYLSGYEVFNPQFEYLYNSYYNSIGEQFPRAQRGLLSRPDSNIINQYRKYVDDAMLNLLKGKNQKDKKHHDNKELYNLTQLMINHEQQHQELMLTDLKHALFINPDYPIYSPCSTPNYKKTELQWLNFDAGLYQIGAQTDGFYFDNEGPQHQVYLPAFQLSSRLVSCGEYLQFIEDGGYQEPSFWLSEAWSKIQEQNISSPYYWIKKEKTWHHYTLSGLVPLDLDSPVMHVNYFEANAYANYKNKRLPTEQEWEVAAQNMTISGTFFDFNKLHPTTTKGNQLEQMFGELWQWTSSSYAAYPGFKTPQGAIGEYNGKFMVNQYVLKGGSIATPKNHIRASYRNFFYPDASWQYTGIRLAESL